MKVTFDSLNAAHLTVKYLSKNSRTFRDFAEERFIQLNYHQRQICRDFQELSIGIHVVTKMYS